MKTRYEASLLLAFVLVASLFKAAQASEIENPTLSSVVITNESAESRLLLDTPDLPGTRGEFVVSAFLDIPLTGIVPQRSIPIIVYRVTTPWRHTTPSWNVPWKNAGGDFHEIGSAAHVMWKGESRTGITFDVTEMVRDIADGEGEDCGFLLTVPEERGKGFTESDLASIDMLRGATLRVTTRPIHIWDSRARVTLSEELIERRGASHFREVRTLFF